MPVHPALLSGVTCALLPVALAAGQFRGPIPAEKEPPARKVMRETRVPVTLSVVILDGSKDVPNQLRGDHNLAGEDEVAAADAESR